MTPKITQNALN